MLFLPHHGEGFNIFYRTEESSFLKGEQLLLWKFREGPGADLEKIKGGFNIWGSANIPPPHRPWLGQSYFFSPKDFANKCLSAILDILIRDW